MPIVQADEVANVGWHHTGINMGADVDEMPELPQVTMHWK
jgi:hypothetical protein